MKNGFSPFYFIFSTFVSCLAVLSYFYDTLPSQFYLVHDESLCVNFEEASRKFINYNFDSFGQGVSTYLIVNFFDIAYYYLAYLFLDSVRQAQMVLLFFKIEFLLLFSYLGFKRLAELFDQKEDVKAIASSLLYTFSMFSIIYFHGNNFSLNQLICYGLSPYIVSSILKIMKSNEFHLKDLLKISISLFVCSFSVFLFAVLLIVIFFIFFFYIFLYWKEIEKKILLKNLFFITILMIPLFFIFGIVPYEHLYVQHESVNSSGEGGNTSGNLKGSILYVWLMYFTWPIYLDWPGKNIYLFSYHFKTVTYIVVVFSLYVYLFKEVLISNRSKITVLFSSLLLFLMVIVKGPQRPFGFIFTSLMQYFPPFRVFRTPDNKISYAIVLVLCCLPIFIHFKSKKHLLSFLMIAFIFLMQFLYPFFNREIIRGNPDKSMDKLIELTPPFMEVINTLNSEKETFYILNLPSAYFGKTKISANEYHWGQDLIAKFTNHYFINYSAFSGISLKLNRELESALLRKDYSAFDSLPIRFYLVRKNIPADSLYIGSIDYVKNHFKKRVENSYFELYENLEGRKFISIVNGNLNFKKDSYSIVQPVDLNEKVNIRLSTAHQGAWKAFKINHSNPVSVLDIFYTIFIAKNEIAKKDSLFNEWDVEVKNKTQAPFQIIVVYENYYIFLILLSISLGTVLFYCLLILFNKNNDISESKGFSNL